MKPKENLTSSLADLVYGLPLSGPGFLCRYTNHAKGSGDTYSTSLWHNWVSFNHTHIFLQILNEFSPPGADVKQVYLHLARYLLYTTIKTIQGTCNMLKSGAKNFKVHLLT